MSYIDIRDNDAWVMNVDGGARRRLGPGESALISPSGKYVAVGEDTVVRLYSTTGASSPAFALGEGAEPLAWSEDSKYVAVNVTGPTGSGGDLTVIDTKTMTASTVAKGTIIGASFRPAASDRLVFASAKSSKYKAAVNLDTINPNGTDRRALTSNGQSTNPLWGKAGIVFDRQRWRSGPVGGFEAQIWLITNAGRRKQLTHIAINELSYGLVPVGFDHADNRLLTEFSRQDDSTAWIVSLPSGHAHEIKVASQFVTDGTAISSGGNSVLMTIDFYRGDAVATVGPNGGKPKVLVKGGYQASWNQ